MINFAYPEILLLAIPLLVLYRKFGYVKGPTGWLRVALVLLLVLTASLPRIRLTTQGTDLVIIVDRSRSMPAGTEEQIVDLIRDVQRNLGEGDRVSVVTFGAQAYVEHEFSNEALHSEFTRIVAANGSDLNEALLTALERKIDKLRPMRILVFSDGEYNGPSPLFAARRCREQGVPVDYRSFPNDYSGDVAVESIGLPRQVGPNEPFQFNVWLTSDRETVADVIISRNGQELSRKTQPIEAGSNRVVFRDWISDAGFYSYEASVRLAGTDGEISISDPVLQNNSANGVVRVESVRKLLVINHDGQEDNLTRSLAAARIPYEIGTAQHPMTQDSLDPFRAVILENVTANSLGRLKMERLAQFVEDLGGGLMMTGGQQSFATGGFYRSPLEELLPVHLESRKETRRARCALAIVLDRSGSMSAPVGAGKMKMDLANLGTAECVRMLNSQDMVAILAVDSQAHLIHPMTSVEDPMAVANRALQIRSMGGGIFVYEGLIGAAQEIDKARDYGTKHIILFADAMDSEQPGNYEDLLQQLTSVGVTVSVIGLGTQADVDAELLTDIARLGNGTISFTNDPQELPRLFAQDALNVTRSTFLKRDEEYPDGFNGSILPNIQLLGEFTSTQFPNFDGYNLTYLKDEASLGVISTDDNKAPIAAFWYRGLGRVVAITPEMDGSYTGELAAWDDYENFVVTHARWLLGAETDNEIFVALRQEGQNAVIEVEVDPQANQIDGQTPELWIVPPGAEREEPIRPQFVWTGPNSLEARFPMNELGTYRTLVKTENGVNRGPALTLPYSPEFLPRVNRMPGEEALQKIAELTSGKKILNVLEALKEPFRAARMISLVPLLCIFSLLALVTEVAGRRLGLWQMFRRSAAVKQINKSPEVLAGERKPARKSKRRKTRPARVRTLQPEKDRKPDKQQVAPALPAKKKVDVFAKAKSRAKNRLK